MGGPSHGGHQTHGGSLEPGWHHSHRRQPGHRRTDDPHTVTDAAILLGALTGVDPKDPQTNTQISMAQADYTQYIKKDALVGAKLNYYTKPNSNTASGAEQFSIISAAINKIRSPGLLSLKLPLHHSRIARRYYPMNSNAT